MRNRTIEYVKASEDNRRLSLRIGRIVPVLSLVVILIVFWYLKLTGITLAGDAFCGMAEHIHDDACTDCTLVEHVHVESCYSDITADIETEDDWEMSFADLPVGTSTAENMVLLARSQLGVAESTRNFEVGADGVRRGITRYGQWYGNPYGDWSAMFASFCLHYAGVDEVPTNAGPESMRLGWQEQGLYKPAAEYTPQAGDLLFLRRDGENTAYAVAVIAEVTDNTVTVIQGDVDGTVAQIMYERDASAILGYGLVPEVSGYVPLIEEPSGYAVGDRCYVWLDGTCGGLMSLGGSDNTGYTATEGATMTLPTAWKSPEKYEYVLKGWYDITNHKYYDPGAEVTVTGNMVFYADWKAATYDVGEFNAQTADTVSTNQFVTVKMFDYGALMNLLSERVSVTVSRTGHSETWQLLTTGNNPYNGDPTFNFIFRDWDRGNEDISYPNGHNDRNNPTDAGTVYSGLYTEAIREALFNPAVTLPGKEYLGEADHLFQLCMDPNHEHYGYYYYNSERNAASYNQSDQRFYVYNYLEATGDSVNNGDAGKYSDFLPLNSPYVNTNGKSPGTYTYNGVENEYIGTGHYMYDSRYNDGTSTVNRVGTNFWFGMSVEVGFYLPNSPGSKGADGEYGNKDVFGADMHFRFTGDDDVWIFVDDVMVLDLGGLHGRETGDINFSTGTVTINGVVNAKLSANLQSILAGEHVLTMYYLERGSSMSNCAIYFNLAPRFAFSIQKEDALTRDVLNGAQFSVYTDAACTIPAELWVSKEAHDNGEPATNVFTVVDGVANMWGMGAGNVYYIRETKPPDDPAYGFPNGLISLTLDKTGAASYNVEIVDDGSGISPGFTVHGFRIDAQTQQAYIVATNAPTTITEATAVQVYKVWDDTKDHSADRITVYLTVTDPDGTVRRIREEILSAENNWRHTWVNLPKTDADGNQVVYGVFESTVPGYISRVEMADGPPEDDSDGEGSGPGEVTAVGSFQNGGTYLLSTRFGYLTADNNRLALQTDQQTAASSDNALWVATVNGDGTVTLTNKRGQTLYYDNYTFKASSSPGTYKNLSFADNRLYCYINHGGWSETLYPLDDSNVPNNLIYNYVLYTTNDSTKALVFTPQQIGGQQPSPTPDPTPLPSDGQYYRITNTPAGSAVTSLTVHKVWDVGHGSPSLYETLVVNVRLLANGQDAGLNAQLSLKNGWVYTFQNLPLYDSDGQRVVYTVEEDYLSDEWIVSYGEVIATGSSPPRFTTTITNTYRTGGPILPATGSMARLLFMICGAGIMLGALIYGIWSKRKQGRRLHKSP